MDSAEEYKPELFGNRPTSDETWYCRRATTRKNEWSGRVEGSMQRENHSDSGQQRSAGCFVHKYGQNNKVKNVVASLERDVSLQQSLPDQNFNRSSFW